MDYHTWLVLEDVTYVGLILALIFNLWMEHRIIPQYFTICDEAFMQEQTWRGWISNFQPLTMLNAELNILIIVLINQF